MAAAGSDDPEVWIGVVHLLPDGERFAVAWVRRSDEWLADTGIAKRGEQIPELARMYRDAVAKRGHAPDSLNIRAALHADAFRDIVAADVDIVVGFDSLAQELSDVAASSVDVIFGAELELREREQQHAERVAKQQALIARMCSAVETQVAENDPPAAAAALSRLQQAGLTREAAVHALAGVLMRAMQNAVRSAGEFDDAAYAAALSQLEAPSRGN